MVAELKQIFDKYVGLHKKMAGKVGAAFSTSGNESGEKETTIISIIQAMLIFGMIILGDPLDTNRHYGISCVGVPNKKTAENAKKFGKRVVILVKKLKVN